MSKKDKKKEMKAATPTVMNPFMFMSPELLSQWQNQMAGMASTSVSTPSSSSKKEASVSKAPWDTSDSSDSDSDFQPSQKQRKVSGSKGLSLSKAGAVGASQSESKRKPGRPKSTTTQLKEARSAEDKKILDSYKTLDATGEDVFPANNAHECKCCRLWTGVMAVLPCGHGKYCFSCISKLKNDAIQLNRPAQCLCDGCYSLVISWVRLYNISP